MSEQRLTLNVSKVETGDIVVGFNKVVKSVTPVGYGVIIKFTDDKIWSTNIHFNTTVIRSRLVETPSWGLVTGY